MLKNIYKIGYVLFIVIILILGAVLILTLFPFKDNFQIKVVQSGSMEPNVKTGSIVLIRPVETYKLGDVITYGKDTRTDVPTTHRIVQIRTIENTVLFTTKGDANEDADKVEVSQKEIIGKVVLHVPYVGYIIAFARKPIGFFLIILVPALIIIGDELIKIWKEVTRLKRKKNELPSEQTQ